MLRKKGLPAFNLKNADIVILGTFPGELSLCKKEYYASDSNHFWDLLKLDKHYMNGLKELKIGLWDVIESCEREGSSDKNIKNATYNDLRLLKGKQIWFNGKRAYEYFVKAQKKQNIDLKMSDKQILPSSSPAAHIDLAIKKRKWNKVLNKR